MWEGEIETGHVFWSVGVRDVGYVRRYSSCQVMIPVIRCSGVI